MTTLYPVSGAFTHYTARFVDPALGFALGWVRLSALPVPPFSPAADSAFLIELLVLIRYHASYGMSGDSTAESADPLTFVPVGNHGRRPRHPILERLDQRRGVDYDLPRRHLQLQLLRRSLVRRGRVLVRRVCSVPCRSSRAGTEDLLSHRFSILKILTILGYAESFRKRHFGRPLTTSAQPDHPRHHHHGGRCSRPAGHRVSVSCASNVLGELQQR